MVIPLLANQDLTPMLATNLFEPQAEVTTNTTFARPAAGNIEPVVDDSVHLGGIFSFGDFI